METIFDKQYVNYLLEKEDFEANFSEIKKTAKKISNVIEKKKGRVFFLGIGVSISMCKGLIKDLEYNFKARSKDFIIVEAGSTYKNEIDHWINLSASSSIAVFELQKFSLNKDDIVIGITSSGHTSYVTTTLSYAQDVGCFTAMITNAEKDSSHERLDSFMSIGIRNELEYLRSFEGTTLMKTMLDLVLLESVNMAGRIWENHMVFMTCNSNEQVALGIEMMHNITGEDVDKIKEVYNKSGNRIETTLISLMKGVSISESNKILEENNNNFNKIFKA